MSSPHSLPTDFGGLHGLDPACALELAMGSAEFAASPDVPTAHELGALLPEYEVEAMIGRGGMGAVYRARQRRLERAVALKVLPVGLGDTPGFAHRFRREAMATARLTHPGIVSVHDTGETVAGHLYYAMDFVEGEDLAQRMAWGRLNLDDAVALLVAVCEVVEAAHAGGIIHRDIKPSNILLTVDGKPKLADFGLALLTEKQFEDSRLTLTGTTLGTLEYAAPEQLCRGAVSTASDLYSLGVLAYELFTGELPRGVFDPPSVRNPKVGSAFDGVVLRALQSDPARRHASVAEFREAIRNAADRRAQQACRERALRQRAVRRARVAVVSLAIALVTATSAVYAWLAKRDATEGRTAALKATAETDELIQFLLTDLQRRLGATGNVAAMDSVLERAVAHFRKKYETAGHSAAAGIQLADTLVTKGDVIGVRGLVDEADALYSEALALVSLVRDQSPADFSRGMRLVAALQDRTEHRMACGRYAEALEDARRMLREARKVQALTDDVTVRRAVAAAHRAVANALGYTQQLDESRDQYLAGQQILQQLLRLRPADSALEHELADVEMSLGSIAEGQQDYRAMLAHFAAYHEFVTKRYGPDNLMYSYSAFRMGVAMVKSGRTADALPFLTDAIRLAERMVDEQPGHKGALNHLSWCLRLSADAHERLGHRTETESTRRRMDEVNASLAAAPDER